MKLAILHVGMLAILIGCSYPVILVGPRPSEPSPPEIEYWIKPGTTAEQRVQDSKGCGGTPLGANFNDQQIEAEWQPSDGYGGYDRYFSPLYRLHDKWERCMLSKGYQYTGQCFDNPVSNSSPACGAP